MAWTSNRAKLAIDPDAWAAEMDDTEGVLRGSATSSRAAITEQLAKFRERIAAATSRPDRRDFQAGAEANSGARPFDYL